MKVVDLPLPGAKILSPRRFVDERGFFSETYNEKVFHAHGVDADFVQDNHSLSKQAHTVRGLHYQSPPFAQAKLVRVVRGAIRDVIIDVRKGSPTFGQHVAVELSAESGDQLLVPVGFLHGFITREPDTEVIYKVDAYYSAECDGAVRWDDPDLGIDWGVDSASAVLSEKDAGAPRYADFQSPFIYQP